MKPEWMFRLENMQTTSNTAAKKGLEPQKLTAINTKYVLLDFKSFRTEKAIF